MSETRRRSRTGLRLVVTVSVLALLAHGCGGGASGEAGGTIRDSSMPGSDGGAEMAAVESGGQAEQAGAVPASAEQGFERMVVKTAELGIRTRNVRASL